MDRKFVFGLIDKLDEYERPSASRKDSTTVAIASPPATATSGNREAHLGLETVPAERTVPVAVGTAGTDKQPEGLDDLGVEAEKERILLELNAALDRGETLSPGDRLLIQRKRCTKCQVVKAFDLFGKNSKNGDGKQTWCKACISGYDADHPNRDNHQEVKLPENKTEPLKPIEIEEEFEHDLANLNRRLTAGEKLSSDERIAIQRKICGRCILPKTYDQFSDSAINGDGKQDWCKKCQNDYDKDRKKTSKPKSKPDPKPSPQVAKDPVEPALALIQSKEKLPEFIWSQKARCMKCGAGLIRFRRHREADRSGNWLHIRTGFPPCVIKISHYQVKDDKNYNPDLDPGAPESWKAHPATA